MVLKARRGSLQVVVMASDLSRSGAAARSQVKMLLDVGFSFCKLLL